MREPVSGGPAARDDHRHDRSAHTLSDVTEPTDDELLVRAAQDLLDAVDSTVGAWVERCVSDTCAAAGVVLDDRTRALTAEAAGRCRHEVVDELGRLLGADVDEQRGTPLQVLRAAVRFPTEVLAAVGVAPVERDEFDRLAFPQDRYGLTPAGFADVDASLAEHGITWGAAKAYVHLARRRDPAD